MNSEPWLTEPPGALFTAHELQCVVARGPMRHWCGYVGIPASHPLHGVEFDALVPYPQVWLERRINIEEHGIFNFFEALCAKDEIPDGFAPLALVFSAHGGLNYSAPRDDDDPSLWFFGFSCDHTGDVIPGIVSMQEEFPELAFPRTQGTYRSIDYVKGECANLADQLTGYVSMYADQTAFKALLDKARSA